jgi:hypothetical protein
VGSPEECATEVVSRFGPHASEVCCYFPGYTPSQGDVAEFVAAVHGA